MAHFFYKLIAPRPTFAVDMTDAEKVLMGTHAVYWKGLLDRGIAVIFGPVADPKGAFGMAVVDVEDEAAARALILDDPVILANQNFGFEIHPMPSAIYRKS